MLEDIWLREEGENNIEVERERRVASERSEASTVQWKISISHGNRSGPPCCSSDRPHLSSWHTFAILQLNPYFLAFSIHLFQSLFLYLTSFYVLILLPLLSTSSPLSLTLFPFSLLPFSLSDSWALTAFYISFFSATAREQPGIGGPCSNKQEAVWFAEGGDTP